MLTSLVNCVTRVKYLVPDSGSVHIERDPVFYITFVHDVGRQGSVQVGFLTNCQMYVNVVECTTVCSDGLPVDRN